MKFRHLSNESIYLLLFTIYAFFYILQTSLVNVNVLYQLLSYCIVLILTILFLGRRKFNIKVLGVIVAISVLFVVTAYTTKQIGLIVVMAFIICADFAPIDKVIKASMISSIIGVLVVVLFCKLGIVEDIVYYMPKRLVEQIHCYGFNYYTGPAYPLFFASLAYLWLKKKGLKILEVIGFMLYNYGLYMIFTVRLIFACAIITAILQVLIIKRKKTTVDKKAFRILSFVGFPVCAGLSIYMSYYYDAGNKIMFAINTLTNRLAQAYIGFHNYPITLFGQKITMVGNYTAMMTNQTYFYIDIGYVYALLGYGVLLFTALIVAYTVVYRYSCLIDDKETFIWLTIVMIFSMVNNSWLTIAYNPMILLTVPAIKYFVILSKEKKCKSQERLYIG